MEEQQNDEDWMPLESNPDVINEYIQKIGFNTEKYCFQDLYDADEQFLKEQSTKTLAALLIYPLEELNGDDDESEENSNDNDEKEIQEDKQNKEEEENQENKEEKQEEEYDKNIFYMKQYAPNACGTIAIMHAALNLVETNQDMIKEDSILSKFLSNTKTMTAKERGEYFMNAKELKEEHVEAVQQGETDVEQEEDDLGHHFICLVPKNGTLYELDGCKSSPVSHGETTPQTLLPHIYSVFQKFLANSTNQYSYSILLLQSNE